MKPTKPGTRQSLVPLAVFAAFAIACMGWFWLYRHGPRPIPEEPPLVSTVSPPTAPLDAGRPDAD